MVGKSKYVPRQQKTDFANRRQEDCRENDEEMGSSDIG
jgi:hypothetical protein